MVGAIDEPIALRAGRREGVGPAYFTAVLTEVNVVVSLVPMPLAAVRIGCVER